MTNPQLVQLGGPMGGPPRQAAPQQQPVRITMLEEDQQLCTELIKVGIPEDVVVVIARSLSKKIDILAENNRLFTQNKELLTANQNLLQQRDTQELEMRRLKKQLGEGPR